MMGEQKLLSLLIRYLLAVLIGLDVLINAILGGEPYQTVSARIGLSIQNKGWAYYIPWPQFLKNHFLQSVSRIIG